MYQQFAAASGQQTVFLEPGMHWDLDHALVGIDTMQLPWGTASMIWQVAEEPGGVTFAMVPAQLALTHRGIEATIMSGAHELAQRLWRVQMAIGQRRQNGRETVNAMGWMQQHADQLAQPGVSRQIAMQVDEMKLADSKLLQLAKTPPLQLTRIAIVDAHGGALTIFGKPWFDRTTAALEFATRKVNQLVVADWADTPVASDLAQLAKQANAVQAQVLACHTAEEARQTAQRGFAALARRVPGICNEYLLDTANTLGLGHLPKAKLMMEQFVAPWMENIHQVGQRMSTHGVPFAISNKVAGGCHKTIRFD